MEVVGVAEDLRWPAAPLPRADAAPSAGLRPLALVADVDDEVRRLIADVLRSLRCEVAEVTDGLVALSSARHQRPDLVVVDAKVPGLHGFEVCRAIRSDATLAKTRVVLCSAAYRAVAVEDARAAFGAHAALEKPFRREDLRRTLATVLFGAAAASPEHELAVLAWRAAAEALGAGRNEDAARLARGAVAHDPASSEAQYYLGHALARCGAPWDAMSALEQAAALRPELPLYHESLAELCEQLGFLRSARAAWMRAAEACGDPRQRRAYEHRLVRLIGRP
jgi:CheY-like chemotaxis protein